MLCSWCHELLVRETDAQPQGEAFGSWVPAMFYRYRCPVCGQYSDAIEPVSDVSGIERYIIP